MNPVRCLIVDDEPLAREIIQTHLAKLPGWELAGSCINAEQAYEALISAAIDVMFLDIQMPLISGIEFLRSLKNPPLVVFTTAYHQYALEGYELNVVDYLMKPITLSRFYQAVEKIGEKLASRTAEAAQKKEEQVPYIFVKDNGRFLKIDFEKILYIKAEKDFSTLFLKEKKLLVSMHLKMLEELLPDQDFSRVHRSYIIHHAAISSICGNTLYVGKEEVPIGANYKEAFFKKLSLV